MQHEFWMNGHYTATNFTFLHQKTNILGDDFWKLLLNRWHIFNKFNIVEPTIKCIQVSPLICTFLFGCTRT